MTRPLPTHPSRALHALCAAALVAGIAGCASTAPADGPAPAVTLEPWPNQDSRALGAIDPNFDPGPAYGTFVPHESQLWIEVPHGERWFVWARSLTTGESQVILEGGRTSFPGVDVVLLSVGYLDSRADNPFFGQVNPVEYYPDLSVGSNKLRAKWERFGGLKEDLVVEISVTR